VGTVPLEGVALVSVENLTGTPLSDTLTGSAVKNTLVGGSGADRMFGLATKTRSTPAIASAATTP
jgi:hypothetical protein